MKTIRVFLADDHVLVRAGIRSLLSSIPDFKVVGEADNGKEALRLIGLHKPEIVLMDIAMPELNGLEVTAQVAKTSPEVHVIVLSMHTTKAYVMQALESGASGYLLKASAPAELELAIRSVAQGHVYLSPGVSQYVIQGAIHKEEANSDPLAKLTARQRQLLQLVAEGSSRKNIAAQLNISPKTVDTYRAQLMKQLNIYDVAGLVRFAIRAGLINADDSSVGG